MINLSFDSKMFKKEMQNIIDYSYGFFDGIEKGKVIFFKNLGESVVNSAKNYVDSNARLNPAALQHMYEWYQNGSPEARLFDIQFTTNSSGILFNSVFKQSETIQDGSYEPFYNKARVMESGKPVTIKPKNSDVLVFESNGELVFTRNPVQVDNPGGLQAEGAFQDVLNTFFNRYFTQAFLRSSGIFDYLKNPVTYKKNLKAGSLSGRTKGIETGYAWIAKAGIANG